MTSGIRLGTPALTTRGMGVPEMRRVAELIDRALTHSDEDTLAEVRGEVEELTAAYPLYQAKPARPEFDGRPAGRVARAVGAPR